MIPVKYTQAQKHRGKLLRNKSFGPICPCQPSCYLHLPAIAPYSSRHFPFVHSSKHMYFKLCTLPASSTSSGNSFHIPRILQHEFKCYLVQLQCSISSFCSHSICCWPCSSSLTTHYTDKEVQRAFIQPALTHLDSP